MENLTTFLNSAGESFAGFALVMLVQSSVLIVILLLLDLILRKKVRAVFRYWIWMLVLVKLVLPPGLCSPTSLGYWFGDRLPVISMEEPSAVERREVKPAAAQERAVERATLPYSGVGSDTAIVGERPAVESTVAVREAPVERVPIEPAEVDTATEPARAGVPLTLKGFLFAGWLAVVAGMVLLLVQRMFFVRGLIAQSEDASERMKAVLDRYRGQMGIRRRIELRLSPVASSPSVCGLTRPIILIPESMIGKLDSQHLRSVLLHELAHIKRGDLWVSLVQTFLQIGYFYNPLLWMANAVMRMDPMETAAYALVCGLNRHHEIFKFDPKGVVLSDGLISEIRSSQPIVDRIDHVYVGDDVALAITSKSHRDDYVRLALFLGKENGRWVVNDVQVEKKSQEGTTIKKFFEDYPEATPKYVFAP